MAADSTSLSHEDLHQLVWTVPGIQFAKRFGLSDTGLAKIFGSICESRTRGTRKAGPGKITLTHAAH